MSSDKLWAASLKGADYQKITDFAKAAPRMLTEVSIADKDDITRDTGLLLTKNQIIDLRKYEAAALALPHTLQMVTDYLRFGTGQDGGPGLRAADFLNTFTETRNHARKWSPLRERIMITGAELKLFGAAIQIFAGDIEEIYLEVKAGAFLDQHDVKTRDEFYQLKLKPGERFPGIELESDTIPEIQYYLGKIFTRVEANLTSVKSIKTDLDRFGYELREEVLPGIKLRVALIDTNPYPAAVKKIEAEINRRSIEIEEKNKEYKALVEKAIGAAAGLNIAGLALGIYYGVEAEAVRSARKKLNEQQDKDIQTLSNMNQTLGSLERVKKNLQDLTIVAIDADLATQNLMHVWNVLYRYVDESASAIAGIDDALSLRRFMTAFREVVSPWVQIQHDADRLIEVFKDADREYNQHPGKGMPRMSSFTIDKNYPALNVHVLNETHNLMRSTAIDAEVLYLRLDYLPGVLDRFKRLVGDVGASARDLRESSISSQLDLESKIRSLGALEKELADAVKGSDDFDEIEEDIAIVLQKLPTVTRREASKLNNCLANISARYDRSVTLGYISGLENDLLNAEHARTVCIEALVKPQGELRVLTDAISAIADVGIEKIGKDIELKIDKLKEMGMSPPEVQLVQFAIDALKQSIADISEAITFVSMIHESDRLRKTIRQLYKNIALQDKRIEAAKGKVQFIQLIHALDDQRVAYADEYKRATSAFSKYLRAFEGNDGGDISLRSAFAIKEAKQFIQFLKPVSQR